MIHRRDFLRRSLFSGAALASLPVIGAEGAATSAASTSETLVKTLYDSLSEAQRGPLCFGFDDPLRSKVSNNWHITEQRIGKFLTPDQNAMVREIFLKAHSDEYAETVLKQVEHDSGKAGFGDSSIAIFGEPARASSNSSSRAGTAPAASTAIPSRARLRGSDLLRTRRGGLQRERRAQGQRLLVSGPGRQPRLPDA